MEQTLGKRIVSHRKQMGLTQDQLAERLGVTAQAVSKWENDQSCPDITMLPKLAEIFGITTDELLGMETKMVHKAQMVELSAPDTEEENGEEQEDSWELTLGNGRKGSLGVALWVLLVGGLLLAGRILNWNISFWGILWPSALLVFGLFGVLPKPSFFRVGCLFFGGYFLLDALDMLPKVLDRSIVFPLILVLFGVSLLLDALRKPDRKKFRVITHNGKTIHKNTCDVEGERFRCSASFGEDYRAIQLPRLSGGTADLSFGELTVDLTGCREIAEGCRIDLNCSFGELNLLVPRTYRVEPVSSTAFASVEVKGFPDGDAAAVIYVTCDANFGEIQIKYV